MTDFDTALQVMDDLFSKDTIFALATAVDNKPSVRMLDVFYDNMAFYIVTYTISGKVQAIETNAHVSLCRQAYRFEGCARNIGHPLATENAAIRTKLIEVFEPWYFQHNNENDAEMCYIKVDLHSGFFHKDGTGYNVDFENRTVQTFPFAFDIAHPE